jgi:hypothetical protein
VVDSVKEFLQVNVDYPSAAFLNESLRGANSVVRAAPRSEAMAVL